MPAALAQQLRSDIPRLCEEGTDEGDDSAALAIGQLDSLTPFGQALPGAHLFSPPGANCASEALEHLSQAHAATEAEAEDSEVAALTASGPVAPAPTRSSSASPSPSPSPGLPQSPALSTLPLPTARSGINSAPPRPLHIAGGGSASRANRHPPRAGAGSRLSPVSDMVQLMATMGEQARLDRVAADERYAREAEERRKEREAADERRAEERKHELEMLKAGAAGGCHPQ